MVLTKVKDPDNADGTKWDWSRALPIDVWHTHLLAGFPGWDRDETDPRFPPHCSVQFICGHGKTAHQVAAWWDDIGGGQFYWQSATDNGSVVVGPGESYIARFFFQSKSDLKDFNDLLPDFLERTL